MDMTFEALTEYWRSLPGLWEELQNTELPIYLYGMGDGAEKIHRVMEKYSIALKGIFASDEYVRGHSFLGCPVLKLSQVEERETNGFIILLAFGAFLPELTEKIRGIAQKHPLYAPDTPVAGETLFTRDFLEAHLEEFHQVFDLLADEKSRQVLKDVVSFKLTGNIDYLFGCESPESEITEDLIPLEGRKGILVDLGGYDGDTVRSWITQTHGNFDHILTLEPDSKNFKKMGRKLEGWDLSRVTRVNAAVSSRKGTAVFAVRGGRNSTLVGTNQSHPGERLVEVPAECVDDLTEGKAVGLIKFDVEGNEAEALRGCAETLRRDHPALMLSAYHRSEDLYALPLLTEELSRGGYRWYLRHHPYIPAWETNFYAVPQK